MCICVYLSHAKCGRIGRKRKKKRKKKKQSTREWQNGFSFANSATTNGIYSNSELKWPYSHYTGARTHAHRTRLTEWPHTQAHETMMSNNNLVCEMKEFRLYWSKKKAHLKKCWMTSARAGAIKEHVHCSKWQLIRGPVVSERTDAIKSTRVCKLNQLEPYIRCSISFHFIRSRWHLILILNY